MQNNVLVTGGTGFVGSALCRHLVGERHWRVTNIDKLTYAANPASLAAIEGNPNYRFEHADICDRDAVTRILGQTRPNAILHLAAESHVDRSITDAAAFMTTNVMGTYTLLECARAYWMSLDKPDQCGFRFLHVSTDEVYGSLQPGAFFTERNAYDPRSPYSASKAGSDHLVSAWHETYGLPTIITNCSNNYGPYQYPEKLIPLIVLNALDGKPLPVYGDGHQERDWLAVEDHVAALTLVLERGRPGEQYVVGARTPRSNLAVVETICGILDRLCPAASPYRHQIALVRDRPGHDRRYAVDPTKLETELGWRAQVSFEAGLEATVRWILANEVRR